MWIMHYLSDDAVGTEPGLFVVVGQDEDGADELAQPVVNWSNRLVDNARHCRRGLRQFVHYQPEPVIGMRVSADLSDHGLDHLPQDLLRRPLLVECIANGF